LIVLYTKREESQLPLCTACGFSSPGGTVIAAKGTGLMQTEKFRGLSLATEREVLLIVASTAKKAAIMQAILEKAGPDSSAGAVCFSLPVSQVAGLRRLDEEEE
jgi:nitrogen regulatory protein PII